MTSFSQMNIWGIMRMPTFTSYHFILNYSFNKCAIQKNKHHCDELPLKIPNLKFCVFPILLITQMFISVYPKMKCTDSMLTIVRTHYC